MRFLGTLDGFLIDFFGILFWDSEVVEGWFRDFRGLFRDSFEFLRFLGILDGFLTDFLWDLLGF